MPQATSTGSTTNGNPVSKDFLRNNSLWLLCSALLLLWGSVVYGISAQWAVYEQYAYGWAVPFLCFFLLWRNLNKETSPDGTTVSESPEKTPAIVAGVVFLLGCIAFLPIRIIVEANPIWRAASYALAIDGIVITLALAYLIGGRPRLVQFAFPFCFFLVAVPWPSAVENAVIQTLTGINTAATVELLGILGIPALQHGNVIEISLGRVGVDEACSGVRSVQATLMMTLFFGAFYRLKLSRRLALISGGLLLALLCNLLRTFFLAWIASRDGLPAVDKWHDPAGVTILVVCFIGIWLAAEAFAKAPVPTLRPLPPQESHDPSPAKFVAFVGSFPFGVIFSSWLLLCIVATELWFRSSERVALNNISWSVKWPEDKSAFRKIPIPAAARDQLKYSEGHHYAWRESDGTLWQSFFLHWYPARTFKERTTVHLAKTHRPERCLTAAGKHLESQSPPQVVRAGDLQLPFRSLVFMDRGHKLHVFFIAWEEGTAATAYANMRNDTASRLAAAWSGNRGKGQRILEVATWGHPDLDTAQLAFEKLISEIISPN